MSDLDPATSIDLDLTKGLLTTDELAAKMGKSPKTLKNWRYERKGPKPTYVYGLPYYHPADIRSWVEQMAAESDERWAS